MVDELINCRVTLTSRLDYFTGQNFLVSRVNEVFQESPCGDLPACLVVRIPFLPAGLHFTKVSSVDKRILNITGRNVEVLFLKTDANGKI